MLYAVSFSSVPENLTFRTDREGAQSECVYGRSVGAGSALGQCHPPQGCRTPGTPQCSGSKDEQDVTQPAPRGTWG